MSSQISTFTSFLRMPHLYYDLIGSEKKPFHGDVLLIGAGKREGFSLSHFPQVDELAYCIQETSTLYVADCDNEIVDQINGIRNRVCDEAWEKSILCNENIVEGPTLAELVAFFNSRKPCGSIKAFKWNIGNESFPNNLTPNLFDAIVVTFSAFYYSSNEKHHSIYQTCIEHLKYGGALYIDKASISSWNNLYNNRDLFPDIKLSLEEKLECRLQRRKIPLNTRVKRILLEEFNQAKKIQSQFIPRYDTSDTERPCLILYVLSNVEFSMISSSPLYAIHKTQKQVVKLCRYKQIS